MKLIKIKNSLLAQKMKDFLTVNRTKIIGYIILIISLIIIIYIGISPVQKINELKRIVRSDSVYVQNYKSIYNNPELDFFVKEKAYKQALLKLSEEDSIHLIVNLRDSIIGLSIKGVIIHKTHIDQIKVDLLLQKLPKMEYIKLFSAPLQVKSQYATIVKEPIVVRHAPKDTAEAAINAYAPDTLIQNPAFLHLKMEYGINIIFEQELNSGIKHKWVCFLFKTKNYSKAFFYNFMHFLSFKRAEYNAVITVKMPADDLRAIYRALPDNAYVVLNTDMK